MKKSGIYCIENIVNAKQYIGSAINLKHRWDTHCCAFRKGIHANVILQRAWNKYGKSKFSFIVIEYVSDVNNLIEREQFWMDKLESVKNGYNISPNAGSQLGFRHTSESKKKISKSKKGTKIVFTDPEVRARNISMARIGYVMPESTKKKLSVLNKGKCLISEEKQKEVILLFKKGNTRMDIAEAVGIDRHIASDIISRAGLGNNSRKFTEKTKIRMARKARERYPLSGELRAEIRHLASLGLTLVSIGEKLGVSRYVAGKTVRGVYSDI